MSPIDDSTGQVADFFQLSLGNSHIQTVPPTPKFVKQCFGLLLAPIGNSTHSSTGDISME